MNSAYNILIISIAIIILFSSAFLVYQYYQNKSLIIRPAPLYKVVKPISFEEFLNVSIGFFKDNNITLKLPTWFPDNIKPVSVWYAPHGSFIAIIAFDVHYVTNYRDAIAGVEIDIISYLSNISENTLIKDVKKLRENGIDAVFYKINGMYVLGIKDDHQGYRVLYVYDISNKIRYIFGVKINSGVTYDELLMMVKSMKPIKIT